MSEQEIKQMDIFQEKEMENLYLKELLDTLLLVESVDLIHALIKNAKMNTNNT